MLVKRYWAKERRVRQFLFWEKSATMHPYRGTFATGKKQIAWSIPKNEGAHPETKCGTGIRNAMNETYGLFCRYTEKCRKLGWVDTIGLTDGWTSSSLNYLSYVRWLVTTKQLVAAAVSVCILRYAKDSGQTRKKSKQATVNSWSLRKW